MRHALQPEFVEASEFNTWVPPISELRSKLTRRLSDHSPAFAHNLRVERKVLRRI